MDLEIFGATMEQAIMDFHFFQEYKNSLSVQELEISSIDFEELGIR